MFEACFEEFVEACFDGFEAGLKCLGLVLRGLRLV